jgi:4-amino-4-deoxy-L-arabinose transferase-like glycosyltransferase
MADGLAARNGGRAGLAALVAILLLGLGLRVGEAWDGRSPVYDATAYAAIAANLDRGEGFTAGPSATQPSSNYSPGLPLFTAGLYELTGGVHERFARLVLALIGTLAILFAYLIARRLTRSRLSPHSGGDEVGSVVAGLIAAAAVAIYPALLEYQGMLMSEPLAATLLSAAVLAIFWAGDARRASAASGSCHGGGGPAGEGVLDPPPPRHPLVRWVLPGVLLGALAMVRPEYLGVAGVLGLVVFLLGARKGWRRSLANAATLLAAAFVVLAPWTVRNAEALGRFVPISTGGGQVLFAGTYLPSGGDPERVGAEVVARHPELFGSNAVQRLRLEQILARLAARRYPGTEADQALSRMGREQLWDDVSEEPLEFAGFVAAKIGRIWAHGPRDVMREPLWEALHWALVGFGLLGLGVLIWRRRREAAVLAAVFLSITALSALLVASPRRVLVMLPLVAACAGVGAVWAAAMLSQRRHSATPARPAPPG